MRSRIVEPEILDGLPEGHPDVRRSRADLRRLNHLMGNYRWLRRNLSAWARPGDHIVELGAGDGEFAMRHSGVRREAGAADGAKTIAYTGIDHCSRPAAFPTAWAWERADVLTYGQWERHSIVVVNLLLHQFDDAPLRALGAAIRPHARVILANETARGTHRLWLARAAFLLGLNRVTRHDAVASVRAGFKGRELADLLGLAETPWAVSIHTTPLGAHRLIAHREDLP